MKDTVTKRKLSIITLFICLGLLFTSISQSYSLGSIGSLIFAPWITDKVMDGVEYLATVHTPDNDVEDGTIMDSIISSTANYTKLTGLIIAEFAIQAMANSFSPSFTTILDLSDRSGGTVGNMYENAVYTKDDVRNSIFMKTIFNLGVYLGAAIAFIILSFNLLMCILGRAEQIKDSPLWLIIKFGVAMFFIYISFDVVYAMIEIMHRLWNGYIWDGISHATIGADGKSGFEVLFGTEIYNASNYGNKSLLGIQLDVWDNVIIGKIVFTILSVFLVWKLFKNILRLYLEIAERYFVLMILACFFPCAVATVVSNGTRNIFSSYLRMFVCQGFVMIANMAFLKFYIYVGQGWMYSLTNWVAGLAYLKVCQKLDSYMMAMGLNVAQTGAGLMGSIGGTLRNGMMMLSMAGRLTGNAGKALMNAGIHNGDFTTYQRGEKLAGGILGNIANQTNEAMTMRAFESSVQKLNGISAGIHNVENGDLSSALRQTGIPETQLTKLKNAGVDIDGISSIEVLKNGDISYRNKDGAVASSIDGQVYTNDSIENDQEYEKRRMEAHESWCTEGEPMLASSLEKLGSSIDDLNDTDRVMAEMEYYATNGYEDVLDANTAVDAPSIASIKAEYGEKDGYFNLRIMNDTAIDTALNKKSLEETGIDTDGGFYSSNTRGHSTLRAIGSVDMGANTSGHGSQFEKGSFRIDCYNAAQFPELAEKIGNSRYPQGEWRAMRENNQLYFLHKTDETHTRASILNLKKGMTKNTKASVSVKAVKGEKPTGNDD